MPGRSTFRPQKTNIDPHRFIEYNDDASGFMRQSNFPDDRQAARSAQ
jgi:hypothetical protein